MADSDFVIEIIARLRDETKAGFAALKTELDRIKATGEASKATQDLGRSTDDLGRKTAQARQETERLNKEHEKTRSKIQQSRQESQGLTKDLGDQGRASRDTSDAQERLAKAHESASKGAQFQTRSQREFADALAKTRDRTQEQDKAARDLELRVSKLSTAFDDFDKRVKSGGLSTGETKRGYSDFSRELNNVSRAFDAGSASAEKYGVMADNAAKKARNAARESTGGFFGSISRGDAGSTLENLSARFDNLGVRISGVSSAISGFFALAKVGLSQQLITSVVALAGGLFSVASAATQAGAALAGAFVSGIGQAIPVISIALVAVERFKAILQAVQVSGQAEQQEKFDPTAKARTTLQNQSQLISSQQQLSNSYIQIYDAQQRVRDSQIALTEAREDAIRNITNLSLAEKQAQLQAEGSDISLEESKRQLQIAIQRGETGNIASAELSIKNAELSKKRANIEVPRAERDARIARERGVGGNRSVISAQEGVTSSKQAVVQAQQAAEAARRQMKITEMTLAAPSSRENSSQAQLKFLLGQMSAPEKALFQVLNKLEKELKSPNSPIKKISDAFIEPFVDAAKKLQYLINNKSFLAPIDTLANTMGKSLGKIEKVIFGDRGTSFFETMAKDATQNIPIITETIEHLIHLFQDIATAAGPSFHKLTEDWNDFWSKLDKKESSTEGLSNLEKFFNKSTEYAEKFAHLGKSLIGLFLALGHDAAPQGLDTVNSLSGAIEKATSWVQSHGSQVTKFFRESKEALGLITGILLGIGKSMLEVFSLSSLEALSGFLKQVLLPGLRDIVKLLGFLTKVFLELADAIPGGRQALEGIGILFASMAIIGKLYEPIKKTVDIIKSLYKAVIALKAGEGIGGAFAAFKGVEAGEGAVAGASVGASGGILAGLAPAASAAAAPLAIVLGAVVSIAGAFIDVKTNFLGVRSLFEKFGDWVSHTFTNAWKELGKIIDNTFGSGTFKKIINILREGLNDLDKIVGKLSSNVVKLLGLGALGALLVVFSLIIISVASFTAALWLLTEAVKAVESGVSFLGKVWGTIWGGIKSIFNTVVGFLAERLSNLISVIKGVVEIANVNLPVVGHIFGSSLSNVVKTLSSTENKLDEFGSKITSHSEHVQNEVPKIANVYSDTFGKVEDTISGASKVVREGVGDIAKVTLNALKNLNATDAVHFASRVANKANKALGFASGGYVSATPGGVYRVAEGGHDEVVLTTDPAHAGRQRSLLGQYLQKAPAVARGYAEGGFVADPGTIQTGGSMPRIVAALQRLGEMLHTTIYGISGARTEAQSAALGYPHDPHTEHKAEDIGVGSQLRSSAARLTAAILAKVGLERPFFPASAAEINHVQLLGSAHGVATTKLSQQIEEITAPLVKGGGVVGGIAQTALDITAFAANKYLGEKLPGSKNLSPGNTTGGASGSNADASPSQLTKWLTEALKITNHYSSSNLSELRGRALQESSGDPKSINLTDSNAKAGHPSKGLLQTIDETFKTYMLPGHGNIWNPVDNAIAAIRYMFSRYGKIVGPSGSGYASGGIIGNAPWGGKPVPIVAHEGERVMNPMQYGAAANMAGTTPSGLDRLFGFASGGKVPSFSLPNLTGFLSNVNESQINSLSILTILFEKIEEGFNKISKINNSQKYLKSVEKFTEQILIAENGVISRLDKAREFTKQKFENIISQSTYLSTNKNESSSQRRRKFGGSVPFGAVRYQGPIGGDIQNISGLSVGSEELENEQKIVNQTISVIKSKISSAKKITNKKDRTKSLNNLNQQYNSAIEKQRELIGLMGQNIEARYQAETQLIQDELSKINSTYQTISSELTTQQNSAQSLGNLSAISGIDQKIRQSASSQINSLTSVLQKAEGAGNTELANQIKQEINGLQQTVTNTVVEQISTAQTLIQQESQQAQSRSSTLSSFSKIASAKGNFIEAGNLQQQSLENNQQSLLSTRAKQEQLKAEAQAFGDTGAVVTLTEELEKNSAEIAENNLALKDNVTATRELTLGQIEREGSFKTGILGSAKSGLEIMGQITGVTNVKGLKEIAQGEGGVLSTERSGLEKEGSSLGLPVEGLNATQLLSFISSPQGMNAINSLMINADQAEKEHIEKVVSGLESNSVATLQNTEELAKLNGQINQPQSWSTTAFGQFRDAIFNGMGGLLPGYSSALPPGSMPTEMPQYGSASPGMMQSSPTIGELHLNHPVEKLDPQMLGEQLSFHIATTPAAP